MNRRGFLKFLTQSAAVTGVVLATGIPELAKAKVEGSPVLDLGTQKPGDVKGSILHYDGATWDGTTWNGTIWNGVASSNLTIETDGTMYISGQFSMP